MQQIRTAGTEADHGTGGVLQVEGEVLCAHCGLAQCDDILCAEEFLTNLANQGDHARIVDDGGGAGREGEVVGGPKRVTDAFDDACHSLRHRVANGFVEGAYRPCQFGFLGDNIARRSRVKSGDSQHHGLGGIELAAHQAL